MATQINYTTTEIQSLAGFVLSDFHYMLMNMFGTDYSRIDSSESKSDQGIPLSIMEIHFTRDLTSDEVTKVNSMIRLDKRPSKQSDQHRISITVNYKKRLDDVRAYCKRLSDLDVHWQPESEPGSVPGMPINSQNFWFTGNLTTKRQQDILTLLDNAKTITVTMAP